MRNKIIAFMLLVVVALTTACGSSENSKENALKKEAQALYSKYYGDNGEFDILHYDLLNSHRDKLADQVKVFEENDKRLNTVVNNIAAEKVSKDLEENKQQLLNLVKAYQTSNLAMTEINKNILENGRATAEAKEKFHKTSKERIYNMKQSRYEYLNTYNKIVYGKPVTVVGYNGKNYIGATASNVDVAVVDISNAESIGKIAKRKPIGKFLICKVVVKNNQKDAITVDSSSFKLIDKKNNEFSVSTEGMTALQFEKDNTRGFLTKLNPTMGTEFDFVFDIPTQLDNPDFKLQATGGFTGSKLLVPLYSFEIPQVK